MHSCSTRRWILCPWEVPWTTALWFFSNRELACVCQVCHGMPRSPGVEIGFHSGNGCWGSFLFNFQSVFSGLGKLLVRSWPLALLYKDSWPWVKLQDSQTGWAVRTWELRVYWYFSIKWFSNDRYSLYFRCISTEDEMVGWHHQLNGHEFEWTPRVDDGQGDLACCGSWDHKESDTTEGLNWSFYS